MDKLFRRMPNLAVLMAIAAVVVAVPAGAQTGGSVFSGGTVPLSVKLGELNSDWRVFELHSAASEYMQAVTAALGTGPDLYFTKGETATIAGATLLIAYHVHQSSSYSTLLQAAMAGQKPSLQPSLTPDSVLSLTLVNLNNAVALDAVRPFDLKTVVDESAKRAADAKRIYDQTWSQYTTNSVRTSAPPTAAKKPARKH